MAKSFTKAFELIATYQSLYQQKYNRPIQVNKYKEKWAASDLIEDFGFETVTNTLVYYFKTSKDNHPITWFYNNFDTLNDNRIAQEKDDILRAERRKQTQQIVMEYRNGVS